MTEYDYNIFLRVTEQEMAERALAKAIPGLTLSPLYIGEEEYGHAIDFPSAGGLDKLNSSEPVLVSNSRRPAYDEAVDFDLFAFSVGFRQEMTLENESDIIELARILESHVGVVVAVMTPDVEPRVLYASSAV